MMSDDYDKLSSTPHEGTMDVQLSLSEPSLGIAQPLLRVLRRDGQIDSFDARKIARTIERAGAETRELDRDTSFSLASAVALYLASDADAPLAADEVHAAVESVLRRMYR